MRRWVFLLACLTGGCAGTPVLAPLLDDASTHSAVELTSTPFYPQVKYQCGPAALATVLNTSGASVTADALVDWVYLPGRRGSLQAELVAAARRYGRVPYTLPPTLDALLGELRAGRPVLVLQNLGLRRRPVWHYAVVVGFDAAREHIVLRSGTSERKVMSARRFERTWRRAASWALVVLKPSELPAEPDHDRYLQAVAGLEATGHTKLALAGYETALNRWPDSTIARLGLGNAHYRQGDLQRAVDTFQALVVDHPSEVIARNNLAHVMHELHCTSQALQEIEHALVIRDTSPALREALLATRATIINDGDRALTETHCQW